MLHHLGNRDALKRHLRDMDIEDLVEMVEYLAERQRTREGSVRSYADKKKAEYGCSQQWQRLRDNPEAYAKKLAYTREWKARKRASRSRDGE